jgi:hypothetical protein
MKINELLQGFSIYTSLEEERVLKKLTTPAYLSDFNERDQVIIEGMVRKSLVIKIGSKNPKVVVNEF